VDREQCPAGGCDFHLHWKASFNSGKAPKLNEDTCTPADHLHGVCVPPSPQTLQAGPKRLIRTDRSDARTVSIQPSIRWHACQEEEAAGRGFCDLPLEAAVQHSLRSDSAQPTAPRKFGRFPLTAQQTYLLNCVKVKPLVSQALTRTSSTCTDMRP
jgi:hypothetical protein